MLPTVAEFNLRFFNIYKTFYFIALHKIIYKYFNKLLGNKVFAPSHQYKNFYCSFPLCSKSNKNILCHRFYSTHPQLLFFFCVIIFIQKFRHKKITVASLGVPAGGLPTAKKVFVTIFDYPKIPPKTFSCGV